MSKVESKVREDAVARDDRSELWSTDERRGQERLAKRMAVLVTSAELFLARGTHRVSMNDVAARLGITKPALYNYFNSKDEVLFECFRYSNDLIVRELDEIEAATNVSGIERLRMFIRAYSRLVATDCGSVMVRLDDRDLPPDMRGRVRAYKRAIDTRIRAIISSGIADGSIVSCDVKMSAFIVFGALNWIGQWFLRDGPLDLDAVGESYALRLTEGLAAAPCGQAIGMELKQ